MRSSWRSLTSSERRSCASSERATTRSPEVSRSSRWTIPGLAGSGPPATRPASASTRVPALRPAPGWTTSPAGLSITARCSSCQAIAGSGPSGRGRGATAVASGVASSTRSPPSSRWLFGSRVARRPRTPASTARVAAAREPRCPARNWSSLSPAASAGTSNTVRWISVNCHSLATQTAAGRE